MLYLSLPRIARRVPTGANHRYRLSSSLASAPSCYFPYGVSNWKTIQSRQSFYVDKTMYIPELERAGYYLKIWRPRRFGKSLFCQQLEYYYDQNVDDE